MSIHGPRARRPILRRTLGLPVLAAALALVASCSNSPDTQVNLSGTWSGPISFYDSGGSLQGTYTLSANATQSGGTVSGIWSTAIPTSGTFSANVNGRSLGSFVLTQTAPSAFSYSGSGTVTNSGSTVNGNVTAFSGGGYALFTLDRQ